MPQSLQQAAVVNWAATGLGNAFVTAVAGAGKTTTLIDVMEAVSANPRTSIAYAAFNKAIADEVRGKLEKRGLTSVKVGTFHSFGWNAWRRAHPKCELAKGNAKSERIKAQLIRSMVARDTENGANAQAVAEDLLKKIWGVVLKLVSYAKADALRPEQFGDNSAWFKYVEHYGLAEEIEDPSLMTRAVNCARAAITVSINLARDLADFDDMLYMPVICGTPMWTNDWLLVDEAQDTNPVRMALARMMVKPRFGRAIFVGDPNQAIYGFSGADAAAVEAIRRDFRTVDLPLTVTYRCPKAIVAEAQKYVSHIVAADEAPDGRVYRIERDAFVARVKKYQDLGPADAILCRKTAPLLEMAFAFIRAGQACHVEGRDIGASLKKLLTKWKLPADGVDEFMTRLEAFTEKEANKARSKGDDVQVENLYDRLEAMRVLAEGCHTLAEIGSRIDALFADGVKNLTLATVHRSKGREWSNVYLLGQNRWMPLPAARRDWEVQQELNLIYVAITRAQETLTYVDVPWDAE